MGKATLIILAAGLFGTAIMMQNATMMAFETESENSDYEGQFIARQIAQSAMNTAVAQAKRDFENAGSISYDDVPYQDGTFDVTAEDVDANTVELEAVGYYATYEYRIRTTLTKGSAFDAALNIEAGDVIATYNGNSFDVDGNDTNPPSGAGTSNADKHGIQSRTDDGRDELRNKLSAGQYDNVRGVDGNRDIVSGAFSIDFFELYEEAKSKADQTLTDGKINGNTTFGSAASPKIIYVNDDLRINGNATGYGVLVVDGDLDLSAGNFTWEGIVVGFKDGIITMTHTGNAKVYGAVVLIARTENESIEEGDADVRIQGNSRIMYSSETISRMSGRLDTIREAEQIVIDDQWSGSVY